MFGAFDNRLLIECVRIISEMDVFTDSLYKNVQLCLAINIAKMHVIRRLFV